MLATPVLSTPPPLLVGRIRELSPADIRARELEAAYACHMMIESTPLGFYDDAHGMDDFPEVGTPAPSDLAEEALMRHLAEHPELREVPRWASYYPPPPPLDGNVPGSPARSAPERHAPPRHGRAHRVGGPGTSEQHRRGGRTR
jgi:hypothetical protein